MKQRRERLRKFFENGKRPDEDQFRDLIDSNLNMLDEGFTRSPENGFEISTPVGQDALMSFLSDARSASEDDDNGSRIDWRIAHGEDGDQLRFQVPGRSGDSEPFQSIVQLDKSGLLDVFGQEKNSGGVIRSGGRQGWEPREDLRQEIVTDGKSHAIAEDLEGMQAFEVVAGAHDPENRRVSLMHAIALSTFNRKNPWWYGLLRRQMGIRYTQAYWGSRCDKLELQWDGESGKDKTYQLKIRSKCDWRKGGGNAVQIHCHVTRLWFPGGHASTADKEERSGKPPSKKHQESSGSDNSNNGVGELKEP
jgi:hypothetical protein